MAPPAISVVDRLIHQLLEPAAQLERVEGAGLGHQDGEQLLAGVDEIPVNTYTSGTQDHAMVEYDAWQLHRRLDR